MAGTTGRVLLWIIGTVLVVLSLVSLVFSFMVHILDWVRPRNNQIN